MRKRPKLILQASCGAFGGRQVTSFGRSCLETCASQELANRGLATLTRFTTLVPRHRWESKPHQEVQRGRTIQLNHALLEIQHV